MTSTATVVDAYITAAGQNQSATVNVPFNGVVAATITHSNPFATVSDFSATIHWPDDGSTSPGSISAGRNGTFLVSGMHTFALPGSWQVRVDVQDDGGAGASAVSVFKVTGGYGGGGRMAASASSLLMASAHPAVATSDFFAIPVALAALTGTEPPAAAPAPGAALDPSPPAASAPPAAPAAAPDLPADAFDPLAAYLAAVAADPAAGPLAAPLSGPDAYFASLS